MRISETLYRRSIFKKKQTYCWGALHQICPPTKNLNFAPIWSLWVWILAPSRTSSHRPNLSMPRDERVLYLSMAKLIVTLLGLRRCIWESLVRKLPFWPPNRKLWKLLFWSKVLVWIGLDSRMSDRFNIQVTKITDFLHFFLLFSCSSLFPEHKSASALPPAPLSNTSTMNWNQIKSNWLRGSRAWPLLELFDWVFLSHGTLELQSKCY